MPADTPPNDLPDHLQLLAGSLIEAAMVLRAIEGPEAVRSEREHLASTLDAIRQGLPTVASGLRRRPATSSTTAPALLAWRHIVRECMTVILGWVHLLAQDPAPPRAGDGADRARGLEPARGPGPPPD